MFDGLLVLLLLISFGFYDTFFFCDIQYTEYRRLTSQMYIK